MTHKEKVKNMYPKAYSLEREYFSLNSMYDIVSEKSHTNSIILGSSWVSFKDAWAKAAKFVDSIKN